MSTPALSPEPYIFLSHAGADAEAARQFAEALRRHGLQVWFDKDSLQPGEPWVTALEQAIERSSGMVVYVGRLGVKAWVDREVRFGLELNTRESQRKFRLIPVLGEGADPASLPPFLRQQQFVDIRDSQQAPEQILRLVEVFRSGSVQPAILRGYWTKDNNPFRGLRTFDSADSWLFFGRDSNTDDLLGALDRAPVLSVAGNSGSGKSSLVRAGLIPALQRGRFRSGTSWVDSWRVAVFRPSGSPFDFLADAVPNQLAHDLSPKDRLELISDLRQKLPTGGDSLRNAVSALIGSGDGTRILLVADQFEEIFTLTSDREVRNKYIDALLAAARLDGPVPVHLIMALRADFYGQCLEHPELSRHLQSNLYNVPPMTQTQLRETVEKRLALATSNAEAGLIDTLLADVGAEPGNLALLEQALTQLWEKCGGYGCTLTNRSYVEIGRLKGAIGKHADAVYERIRNDQKPLAQKVFLELVQLGKGAQDTRRRVPKDELLRLGDPNQVERLLGDLASQQLVSTSRLEDQNFVEVSHEALIREWPKLRKWLDSNREDLELEERLRQAAQEWEIVKRDPGALLRGTRLSQGREWLDKHPSANPLVQQFLQDSIKNEQVLQRKKVLRTRRNWSVALGLMAVFTIIAVLILRVQRNSAEARELSAWAAVSLNEDPQRSLILGLHSWNKRRLMLGGLEESLQSAVRQSFSCLTLDGHQDEITSIAWSPDGTKLATGGLNKTVKVWEADTGHEVLTLRGHEDQINSVAWSKDGSKLATASTDGTVRIWDIATGNQLQILRGHTDEVWAVRWSPDGTKLATASSDKTAKVWEVASGRELLTLRDHQGQVFSIAWSNDGTKLATASDDKTAKIWDAIQGNKLVTLLGHADVVRAVVWSPTGDRVATASYDRTTIIWDVANGRPLRTLKGHKAAVKDVVWSADGHKLATASSDRTAKLWEVDTGQELLTLRGHQAEVKSIAWSPRDGDTVVTASSDDTATVWNVGNQPWTLKGHEAEIKSIVWSPDGTKLATASYDHTAKVWQAATGHELITLRGHQEAVSGVAWSSDGRLATASNDRTAKIWDALTGHELLTLSGHQGSVTDIAWSPKSDRLATTSSDKTAKVWDSATGRELLTLRGHSDEVRSVSWSPDGSKLATSSYGYEQTAIVWDAATGRQLFSLSGHQNDVWSIAWSPDGSRLATASYDRTAKVWDAGTGRELLTLHGNQAVITSIAWSPDGTKLATGGYDATAKVWDAVAGRELLALGDGHAVVTSVSWSPNGKYLASASADGVGQVYTMDHDELLRLVKSHITRQLTPDECWRYLNTDTCPPLPSVP